MKLYLECIPCFIRQALEAINMFTDDQDLKEKIMREVIKAASTFDADSIGLMTNAKIQRILKKYAHSGDPYKKEKEKMNIICMDMADEVINMIEDSGSPFETALRIAIGGNIIDFGQGNNIKAGKIRDAIKQALGQELDNSTVNRLREEIERAEKILYIGDNTGEIVFDRIFIERFFPPGRTIFAVRGGPVMNDATIEDAKMTGMTDTVRVISTGIDMAGALLPYCSEEFMKEYGEADIIISKGMGNYEALSNEDKNIFYLMKVKCPVVEGSLMGKYRLGDILVDDLKYLKNKNIEKAALENR
jgi:damage-control phosphatase, subfamily I